MYELAFTSQQKMKLKEFRKYCCNTGLVSNEIRQKLVDIDLESSNRRHQLAIRQKLVDKII